MSTLMACNWTLAPNKDKDLEQIIELLGLPKDRCIIGPLATMFSCHIDSISDQEEIKICRLLEEIVDKLKLESFWKTLTIQTLNFTVRLERCTLDMLSSTYEAFYEKWEKVCRIKDVIKRVTHRLLGPAEVEAWFVHGQMIAPFDDLLRGEISWQQFFEIRPYDAFVLVELHNAGLIKIDAPVFDNLKLMLDV